MSAVYLVFAGDRFYPEGGASDLAGIASTEAEALAIAQRATAELDCNRPWANVLRIDDVRVQAAHCHIGRLVWAMPVACGFDLRCGGKCLVAVGPNGLHDGPCLCVGDEDGPGTCPA